MAVEEVEDTQHSKDAVPSGKDEGIRKHEEVDESSVLQQQPQQPPAPRVLPCDEDEVVAFPSLDVRRESCKHEEEEDSRQSRLVAAVELAVGSSKP